MKVHHYTECGLSNVLIHGIQAEKDDDGDDVITIPAINDLHRVIAEGIVEHENAFSGDELRFLRSEMGLTQSELAKLVHRDKQSLGRWERSEIEIDSASEVLIRRLAIEKLSLQTDLTTEELSSRSVPGATPQPIEIDAKFAGNDDTTHYSLRAA